MTLKITDSDITREQLLKVSDFNETTKKRIQTSDVLIVPNMQFRGDQKRLFYQGTSDFLKLAKEELSQYSINLCENEGSEESLTLRSGEIWIPVLLISIDPIKDVILPAVINFAIGYIFYKFTKDAKENKPDVHLKVLVENKKTKVTKTVTYDGKVSGLKTLKIDAKKIFD